MRASAPQRRRRRCPLLTRDKSRDSHSENMITVWRVVSDRGVRFLLRACDIFSLFCSALARLRLRLARFVSTVRRAATAARDEGCRWHEIEQLQRVAFPPFLCSRGGSLCLRRRSCSNADRQPPKKKTSVSDAAVGRSRSPFPFPRAVSVFPVRGLKRRPPRI